GLTIATAIEMTATTTPTTAGSALRRRRPILTGSNSTLTHQSWHASPGDASDGSAIPVSAYHQGMGSSVGQQYLLLADISGYSTFVVGVEGAHGVDFSD